MAEKRTVKEQTRKTIPITLDRLPAGKDMYEYGGGERYSKKLPDGVTRGQIYKDVIRIGWPAFMELMLTQLVGMFDQIQVGAVGPYAISAVGLSNQPKFLLMTAFMSMNVGTTAMIARARGRKDAEAANLFLRQGMSLTFVLSVIMSIIGYIFARPLCAFIGASDLQTLEAATEYLQIMMIGMVGLALTNVVTSALRGVGNTRAPLIYNVIANTVNIFFNYVLITGQLGFPRLEVRGAAIATVIGQTTAFVIAMIVITFNKSFVRLDWKPSGFKLQKAAVSDIVRIGLPAAGEQLVMRAGMILYNRIVASLGTNAYATHTICMNIQALTFMNGQAFAVSATSLVGQSLGKKRPDMAQAYSKTSQNTGFFVALIFAATFLVAGGKIVGLYTDVDEIIRAGQKILLFVAFVQPFQSSQLILAGAMRGAGDTKFVAYITAFTMLVVRPAIAALLVYVFHLGIMGAWYALAADQLTRTLLVFMRYHSGKWKTTFRSATEASAEKELSKDKAEPAEAESMEEALVEAVAEAEAEESEAEASPDIPSNS